MKKSLKIDSNKAKDYSNYLTAQKKVKKQKLAREVTLFLEKIKYLNSSNDILSNAKIIKEMKNTSQEILIGAISRLIQESN